MLRGLIIVAVLMATVTSTIATEHGDVRYRIGETQRAFDPGVERNWRGARTERLVTTLWYPADAGDDDERARDIGPEGHPVFRGRPAAVDAPISAAEPIYPLILLSHGTGGSAASLDWLAASLAAEGYIVAGVDHPGNNALEPLTPEGFTLWWERATDISEVLNAMLTDPTFGPRIDGTRIGAAGFSLGGYTVLELAGARTDRAAFEQFCRSPAADAVCHPTEMSQLGKGATNSANMLPADRASIARAAASYRDKRIKAVFAIAPALGEAFDSNSLAGIKVPVSLVAGTADVTVPPDTNIQRIARLMRVASVTMVPGASHNTFLDTCFPETVDKLAALCKDGPGVDRDTIHEQTAQSAIQFFNEALR
jgi:predicted dienelactone hydrolase